MKRLLCVIWTALTLTACAAPPPDPLPVPSPPPSPEQTEPEYSPLNPAPENSITLEEGKRYAQIGVKSVEMPAAPFIEHDAFYFPLQFVAETLGVQYAFANNCAYLQCDGHVTQFYIDSPRFNVDGAEGQVSGTRTLYREGLPTGPADEQITPLLRNGVVFLPVDYLPSEYRMPYNSFGAQLRPDSDHGNLVRFQNDRFIPTEVKTAHSVTLCPGVSEALVDGERKPLPAAPFIDRGVFYFPVETVSAWLDVNYTRSGSSIHLTTPDNDVQLFLNTRQYILNGQPAVREGRRANHDLEYVESFDLPADDGYTPVERNGTVYLPSDYLGEDMDLFFRQDDYIGPTPKMMIFSQPNMAEDGIGGFCLGHKFDDTPSELRAGLHCIGKLGEYQTPYREGYGPPFDTVYDIIGYAGNGLHVHVLRLHPGFRNNLMLDGTISAVSTDNPELSTPRGLRCGDLPRRAWEIYGKADGALYFDWTKPNGPITSIGFTRIEETPAHTDTSWFYDEPPAEWFETPAFWEQEEREADE